ncbi:hypothetical protein BDW22DRAFT_954699 [Trametopsis cervina]|nr:hypothetical protein BDW22DRAFT_954699 [Trametopsis cervina]
MPHKRAKRSTREQLRSKDGHDRAPEKMALANEAIPKGAARILNAAQVQQDFHTKRKLGLDEDDGPSRKKRQKVSESSSQVKGAKGKNGKADIKITPGESLAHFNRRVEESLRPLVRDAMQTSAAVARKVRKQEEEDYKASKKGSTTKSKAVTKETDESDAPAPKTKPAKNDSAPPAPATPKLLKDSVPVPVKEFTSYKASAPRRLNDIALAPPELSKLPRGAKAAAAARNSVSGTKSTSLREGALSMAQKAILEEERERVIKAYREMKKGRNA